MRPSEQLKQNSIEDWNNATNHPFTTELAKTVYP